MKVLIACECSGIVRDSFLRLGHEAISCDLKPTQSPGPHFQGDVREILSENWDLLIAHPVCRYLCNSGVRWLHEREGRFELMKQAAEFFLLFENAKHIPKRAIENPIMHKYALKIIKRQATQFIQPYEFGDPFQKATGLWLYNLPKLKPTHKKRDFEKIEQYCANLPPSENREELRSKTYPGIANAMSSQWGKDGDNFGKLKLRIL